MLPYVALADPLTAVDPIILRLALIFARGSSLFLPSIYINTSIPCAMMPGKAVIGETDMLQTMQQDAVNLAAKALDHYDVTEATEIARFIKREFDGTYGPGWQCVVGTDFGSFVTHCHGCFIYFCIGSLAILLFRGSAVPEADINPFPALELESVKA